MAYVQGSGATGTKNKWVAGTPTKVTLPTTPTYSSPTKITLPKATTTKTTVPITTTTAKKTTSYSAPKTTTTAKKTTSTASSSNVDYQAEMQRYLASGGKTTDAAYKSMETARQKKIAAASPEQLKQWGIGTYDPKTGTGTFDDGTSYTKYTYENGVPTNAGTGEPLPSQPGSAKTPTAATPEQEVLDRLASLEDVIKQLTSQPQTPAYDIEGARSSIRSWGENIKDSLRSKIEAARQSGLGQYANAGTLATQQTKQSLDQNAVDKAKAIEAILQASEAAGQGRGGMNVSGQVAVNTAAQQNANAARQTLANNLSAIDQARANVNTQADQSQIQSEAEVDAQVLQAILNAEQFGANYNATAAQNAFENSLTNRQFEFSSDLQTKQYTSDEAWKKWQQDFATEQQAWERDSTNPNVQAQVLANQSATLQNKLAALELQNYPEEQKLRMEQLKKEIAQIGKTPAVSDYEREMQRINLAQANAELDNMRKGQRTDYTPYINQLYVTSDQYGGTSLDTAGLIGYLQNLENSGGLTRQEAASYAAKYGIQLP